MLSEDPLKKILFIDLTSKKFWIEEHSELFEKYIGGAGVAIKLLEEHCPKGQDPLEPENPIIFAVGPLVGHFPLASKTVAMFKSPLSGNLGESHAGGRSATSIRSAGYGAILIKGKSSIPIYLTISNDHVRFHEGSALWGMRSSYTVADVLRDREKGSGKRSIMRIGRAGEKKVRYACVITETYRHFGRLGLGAVFGSKNLKALSITGQNSLPVVNKRQYREVYDEIYQKAIKSSLMQKYHELGTSMNISPLNAIKALPTHNLQLNHFEGADEISGEEIAKNYLGRRLACSHCPVACIHLAAIRIQHPTQPYFYTTSMLGYDYEPLYSLGTMVGCSDVNGMFKLMDEVEIQGLDAMSTGVALAWATEAYKANIISIKETNGLELEWGDCNIYIQAVRNIVNPPNEFYTFLAKGTQEAAKKYGGEEFALNFGGNEMAGYHTGPACYVNYITGARHSHLDSAGYSLDQKMQTKEKPLTAEDLATSLLEEEQWRQILSSLVTCFFARNIYNEEVILKALSVLGFEFKIGELKKLGSEILRLKYDYKVQEGFNPNKYEFPNRIYEIETPMGYLDKKYMEDSVKSFFSKI